MDTMMESLPHQAAVAAMFAHAIQLLKNVPGFKWLNNGTAAKLFGAFAAFIGTLGVHWQLTGSLVEGGQIILAWPMLSVMMEGVEHLALQWVMQEFYYQQAVKPAKTPPQAA